MAEPVAFRGVSERAPNGGDALFAWEVGFPGRIGIVHCNVPGILVRDHADFDVAQYHLASA